MIVKWNSEEIIKFLEIFRQYEVLYNTKHCDYLNKAKRNTAFDRMKREVNENGLIIDTENLKKKIKSIKDSYRHELNKVNANYKTISPDNNLYTPKLLWYPKADFLGEHMITRKSTSNLEVETNMVMEDDENELQIDGQASDTSSISGLSTAKKRKQGNTNDAFYSNVLAEVSAIEARLSKKDSNDAYAEYISFELKKLSPLEQTLLKRDISTAISNFFINKFTTESNIVLVGTDEVRNVHNE